VTSARIMSFDSFATASQPQMDSSHMFANSDTIQIFNRYCDVRVEGSAGRAGSLQTDSTLPAEKKPLSYAKYISLLKSRKIIPAVTCIEKVV
jgi:hypothetical protein